MGVAKPYLLVSELITNIQKWESSETFQDYKVDLGSEFKYWYMKKVFMKSEILSKLFW